MSSLIEAVNNEFQDYTHQQYAARISLPSRVIELAQTEAFNKVGYPVGFERNSNSYLDSMQELRFEQYFGALGGMTQEEFDEFKAIFARINATLSREPGTRPSQIPCAACIPAFIPRRYIQYYFPQPSEPNHHIVEIGPGSGYLSLLLARQGYYIDLVEIAPAFVKAQIFMRRLFNLPNIERADWWHWYMQHTERHYVQNLSAIVANHCLNELHINALMYNLQIAKKRLRPGGLILAEQLGSPIHRTDQQTLHIIHSAGFRLAQHGTMYLFAPPQSESIEIEAPLPLLDRPVSWENILEYFEGRPPLTEDEKLLTFLHKGK